jgi:hypothetical protein
MGAVDGRTWLEHLSPAECWRLLASTPVGRIGVLNDSAPEIYPVNHVVDRETIVFRTDAGGKLRGLTRSPAVCYQVDGIVLADATGWSVLVKGRAVSPEERVLTRPCGPSPTPRGTGSSCAAARTASGVSADRRTVRSRRTGSRSGSGRHRRARGR